MFKEPATTTHRLKRELDRVLTRIRVELDRVEILSTALAAFSKPVPGYEPGFQHLRRASATAYEIKG